MWPGPVHPQIPREEGPCHRGGHLLLGIAENVQHARLLHQLVEQLECRQSRTVALLDIARRLPPGPGTTRAVGAPPPPCCCIMASRAPSRAAPRTLPDSELRGRPQGPAPSRSISSGSAACSELRGLPHRPTLRRRVLPRARHCPAPRNGVPEPPPLPRRVVLARQVRLVAELQRVAGLPRERPRRPRLVARPPRGRRCPPPPSCC
jgi:hypothetical protein